MRLRLFCWYPDSTAKACNVTNASVSESVGNAPVRKSTFMLTWPAKHSSNQRWESTAHISTITHSSWEHGYFMLCIALSISGFPYFYYNYCFISSWKLLLITGVCMSMAIRFGPRIKAFLILVVLVLKLLTYQRWFAPWPYFRIFDLNCRSLVFIHKLFFSRFFLWYGAHLPW